MPISKPNLTIKYLPSRNNIGIDLPLSKSIANRLITLHAAYGQKLALPEKLLNDDITAMQDAVTCLHSNQTIDAKDAGTVLRFILALASNTPHFNGTIIGSTHLFSRPIEPLIAILNNLGADISTGDQKINITGKPLEGGELILEKQQSSQFISAILLISSLLKQGIDLKVDKEQNSKSYIDLTIDILEKSGIYIEAKDYRYQIPFQPGAILTSVNIERDWSAVSFFICLSLLKKETSIYILDLSLDSSQAEALLCKQWIDEGIILVENKEDGLVFKSGKASLPLSLNFDNYPDAALNVILTFVLLKHSFTATGVSSLNLKESKRLDLIIDVITVLGARVEKVSDNEIDIKASDLDIKKEYHFSSSNDHRMAVALTLLAAVAETSIENPVCINKSFPYFWDEINKLGFIIS